MPRCLHICESGFQCLEDAMDSSDCCEAHHNVLEFERLHDPPLRKIIYRVIALVLLLLFLVPLFFTLRNLYSGSRPQALEVW